MLSAVLLASLAWDQAPSAVREEIVYSFPSYVISNDKLELAVAARGGAMLRLLLQGDPEKLSPFGNPEKLTLNPAPPHPPELVGHFVCVDGFGPVSPEERKAGLSDHGEAHVTPWQVASSGKQGVATALKFTVTLPVTQEIFTRTFTLVDGESVVYVDSELESLLGFDRPVNWAEHATIAAPFLEPEKNFVDLSSARSKTRAYAGGADAARHRLASFQDFTWPMAPAKGGGPAIDLRGVPASPDSVDHTATLYDPSQRLAFVTAVNPARQYLLGYILRSAEYPWIQLWMSYNANGWLERGLEFATQPFDVPRRETVTTGTMFDTPLFRWLPAKSKITTRFAMFYAKTPAGMSKIDDVRLEGGKIIVEDRAAGRQVALAASLPL
jgi:hypothetical protein